MSAIANLSLQNGRATPVAVVFSPVRANLNEAMWADRTSGRYIGLPTVRVTSRLPTAKSTLYKVNATVEIPVMETITNANSSGYTAPPQAAYVVKANVQLMMPSRSSLIEREDVVAFTANLLKDVQFLNVVRNFELPW